MDFVEGETGYCSETCVSCGVDGTEEFSIKVEEPIDIKEEVSTKFEAVYIQDEIQEQVSVPPVKNENEVRLQGVCEVVAADATTPKGK
jgi:hypothetical protein